MGKHLAALAEGGVPVDDGVLADLAAIAQHHVGTDGAEGADFHISPDAGSRIDDSGWMNAHDSNPLIAANFIAGSLASFGC